MTWGLTVKREGFFENALRFDVKKLKIALN